MKNPSVNDAAPNADPDAPLARLLGPWLENLHENLTDHIRHTRHTVSHVANRWSQPHKPTLPRPCIACKRIDSRDEDTKSIFNKKREMPVALREVILGVNAEVAVVSYNDESWVTAEQMMLWLSEAGYEDVRMLAYDSNAT